MDSFVAVLGLLGAAFAWWEARRAKRNRLAAVLDMREKAADASDSVRATLDALAVKAAVDLDRAENPSRRNVAWRIHRASVASMTLGACLFVPAAILYATALLYSAAVEWSGRPTPLPLDPAEIPVDWLVSYTVIAAAWYFGGALLTFGVLGWFGSGSEKDGTGDYCNGYGRTLARADAALTSGWRTLKERRRARVARRREGRANPADPPAGDPAT